MEQLIKFIHKTNTNTPIHKLMQEIILASAIGKYDSLSPITVTQLGGFTFGCYSYKIAGVTFFIHSKSIYGESSRQLTIEVLPQAELKLQKADPGELDICTEVVSAISNEINLLKKEVSPAKDYWNAEGINGFTIDNSVVMLMNNNIYQAHLNSYDKNIRILDTHRINQEGFFKLAQGLPPDILSTIFRQSLPSLSLSRADNSKHVVIIKYKNSKTSEDESFSVPAIALLNYCGNTDKVYQSTITYPSSLSGIVAWFVKQIITTGGPPKISPVLTIEEIEQFFAIKKYLGIRFELNQIR